VAYLSLVQHSTRVPRRSGAKTELPSRPRVLKKRPRGQREGANPWSAALVRIVSRAADDLANELGWKGTKAHGALTCARVRRFTRLDG